MTPGHLQMRSAYSFDTSKINSPAISIRILKDRQHQHTTLIYAIISNGLDLNVFQYQSLL